MLEVVVKPVTDMCLCKWAGYLLWCLALHVRSFQIFEEFQTHAATAPTILRELEGKRAYCHI
jgi:hypothetical protein